MSVERNVAAQARLTELINSGNIDDLDEVFSDNVVDHDPAPGQQPGPAGFKDLFTAMRSAFPDLMIEPATSVTDDHHVCVAYTISGTHQGDFHGIAATGHKIMARGVQIARFDGEAKIIERWGSSDELTIFAQLGATPRTK